MAQQLPFLGKLVLASLTWSGAFFRTSNFIFRLIPFTSKNHNRDKLKSRTLQHKKRLGYGQGTMSNTRNQTENGKYVQFPRLQENGESNIR